jgi:lipid II:glycine glycyltransferase (peptidoglycan interpeptide bridge formation enzyme)
MTTFPLKNNTFVAAPKNSRSGIQQSLEDTGIEYIEGHVWDEVASNFSDAVHEQTHCFNAARWGSGKIENVVFREQGEIIGGASVIIIAIPFLKGGIAIVKWGPVWRRRGETPVPERLASILRQLQQEFAVRRGLHLTLMPHADPEYSAQICSLLESLGFKTGASLPAPERYLVNTSVDADELRLSLDQKWRYNLKKSEKHEFSYEFATGQDALATFNDLYSKMLLRKNFDDHSAIYTLEELMKSRSETFRPAIVLVSYQGEVTAGGVFDLSGERAVYLYGATDDRALRLKAGYALHWWVASYLCNQPETRWYDLGGNDLDRGLHQFKKGFVGKSGSICVTPAVYHYGATTKSNLIGQTIFRGKEFKASLSRSISALKKLLRK